MLPAGETGCVLLGSHFVHLPAFLGSILLYPKALPHTMHFRTKRLTFPIILQKGIKKERPHCDLSSFNFWLGWRDSNPRVTESESVALPLGDTPVSQLFCRPLS